MNRRFPRHLFAITGRLLLAVALVFSTGPWAAVLASTQAAACQHMMGDMPHAVADGSHDCCPDADAGGMPDCGKHGSTCTGICTAVCGLAGSCTVPAAIAFTGLPVAAATPLPRPGVHAPSMFAAPALRPPISV